LMRETEGLVNFILKFANDNPESLASFYAINSLNPSDYEKEFIAYSDKIKSSFNDNASVTEFLVRMAKLKTVQIGQVAPAFTIKKLDGSTVSLADFKGKYVLLDFWASWCMPCRQENPNVVKAYNKYKDRNFTIFSVSLDKDPAAWKQAIAADNLTWTHAGELSDFEGPTVRLYQVEAIPSSFIIDPAGKIIAKNLRGDGLDSFLASNLH
jgi:peroxiredoxin